MLTPADQPHDLMAATRTKPHPLWVRSFLCVWVMLFGVVSCAQAAHTHGEFLPQGKSHTSAQLSRAAEATQPLSGEETCPLCIAMHIAMPTTALPVVHISTATTFIAGTVFTTRAPQSLWHFDLFGRPPPALRNS